MRMRPILMSAPMVLATLADIKTVTRRLTGLEEVNEEPDAWDLVECAELITTKVPTLQATFWRRDREPVRLNCPYGVPGEGLWVRENFRLERRHDHVPPSCALPNDLVWYEADGDRPDWSGRLRPSIHLPREFSRLDLEQHAISLQRLQRITEDGCKQEGVTPIRGEGVFGYRTAFVILWDEINPRMPFKHNPWVWVVNFKPLIPFQ